MKNLYDEQILFGYFLHETIPVKALEVKGDLVISSGTSSTTIIFRGGTGVPLQVVSRYQLTSAESKYATSMGY